MGAATPESNPEADLDAILNNIDKLVDHQCKKATDIKKKKATDTPTRAFSLERYQRTRKAFQALSETQIDLAESNNKLPVFVPPEAQEKERKSAPSSPKRKSSRATTWFGRLTGT